MTMIVNLPTKKALKEAIAVDPQSFVVVDPALMPEWRKYGERFRLHSMKPGESIVVTNHPKRSWFAEITAKEGGTYKVA